MPKAIQSRGVSMDVLSSAGIVDISAEAVTIPSGAAGSVVNFQLANFPIQNTAGGFVGGDGDSSISLTATAFTNEVAENTADAELSNGDFYCNYLTGECRGKKADTSTSMTAAYKVSMQKVSLGTSVDSGSDSISTRPKTVTTYVSTALENSEAIRSGSTDVISVTVTNTGPAQYIQLFNQTSVPADTAVPDLMFAIPAGNGTPVTVEKTYQGVLFDTGLAISNSSTAATKTIGSADCWFEVDYEANS